MNRTIMTALLPAALSLASLDGAAAQTGSPVRANAATAIANLGNAMPRSFDIRPSDPCAGIWAVQKPAGDLLMEIIVMRYRNLPMAHLSRGSDNANQPVTRLDPRSIQMVFGGYKLVLRCAGVRAIVQLANKDGQTAVLKATSSGADNEPSPAAARPTGMASVRVHQGDIQYVDAAGNVRQITSDGNFSEPVLSPDGRTIAFIHLDGKPTMEGEAGFTSLWLADAATGETRRLLASKPDQDTPERNLASFGSPRFSLDGGFVYIDAEAWTTSTAVHQVGVTTGKERFVVAGSVVGVIRNGPHRRYLLVSQHRYRKSPEGGSYDPVIVVRPDGTEVLMVPGTDGDDDTNGAVAAWLKRNGWQAW